MLSPQSVTTLRDILENRISVMEVTDRDDMRELSVMKRCLAELAAIAGTPLVRELDFSMIDMPRRGRRRALHA